MDSAKRTARKGPSTPAMPSATTPKPADRAAIPAATFSRLATSIGFSVAQVFTRSMMRLKPSTSSMRVGRSVSPRALLRLNIRFCVICQRADRASLRMSPSRCIDPLPLVLFTSSSWRRYSPMLAASFAASSPYSLPNSSVITPSCLALGNLLTASSTFWMVPVASLAMPSCTDFASSPTAASPF
ncbi:hypothetical protein D3C85_1259570 [compost metagenome]